MKWFAIQVRGGLRAAEIVKRILLLGDGNPQTGAIGPNAFFSRVPVITKTVKGKVSRQPVLPGYVLVKTDDASGGIRAVMQLLRSDPAAAKCINDLRLGPAGAVGVVTADEMSAIEAVERYGVAAVDLLRPEEVPVGEEIEIAQGEFEGLRARLAKWKGSARLGYRMVVHLEGMGRVLVVELDPTVARRVRDAARYRREQRNSVS